ncbi:PREDICTED: stonustoxin subunit beta-like [Cyprinodon variegatus]|uniref:stonustoxin subunit beta-like n=1 Tax=Cyprinodon variegatus TaxID=28743 RepID=UPI000742C043|nr:PREDICTED: stonustoxin subunit beta-like [Cyprinodon variegatus]
MASDQMEVAALGRPFALGMLYDAYRDKLITDFSLWDRETIQKYKIKKTQNGTFCETTVSDSIDEKASLLKADASLIVSFLSGLVEVGGAANYLLDDKEFKNQSRVIHQYRATTAYERLELNHQDAKKLQIEEVIRNSNATHVVTGILYGANAFFVFDNYCDLTLDPETVNGNLVLSEGDKKATCGPWQQYPKTEKRFNRYPQVLCREGLKGCHYFEVMWSNETTKGIGVGLAYEGVPRNGNGLHTGFGYNDISWYFGVYSNSYCVWHNSKKMWSSTRPSGCNRIGVYLDWPGGTLSFYQVSSNSLTHLHTFEKRFSVPLYPGFYIWDKSTYATFCPA